MKSPILGKILNKEIVGYRNLSVDEFSQLKKYRSELRDYLHMGELLSVALLNHDEFISTLNHFSNEINTKTDIGYENYDRIVFELNRRILNYLSGVRTFLDHSAKRISETCGKDKLDLFNEICSFQYDESFAYRFLYRLRNYTQHRGMPIGNVIATSSKDKDINVSSELTFVFDRDSLLSEYDGWGKAIKVELQSLEPYFDVPSLLAELMNRIGVVHIDTMNAVYPSRSNAANFILSLYNELNDTNCRPVIFDATDQNKNTINLNMLELPVKHAYWVLNDLSKQQA